MLYLIAGIVPWFFFQDGLIGGTNSMLEYSYLVKKVVFQYQCASGREDYFSGICASVFCTCLLLSLYCFYGHFPDLYYLQLFYYTGRTAVCSFLGLSYMTSSVVIFFRDLSQMISIALQIGVWLTPIMWVAEDKLDSAIRGCTGF